VKVFSHPEVTSAFEGFTLLKIDLTNEAQDESLTALREKYGVATLPAVRVVSPTGKVTAGIDQLVDVPEFLGMLSRGRACAASAAVC
jgi:thiol:disulfide interchange protein